jgi:transposase InsO family protein
MNPRNGKIARLPLSIRSELNQRLEASQPGPQILAWLNALDETESLVQNDFDGVPISKQNLSEWRQGGFQEWLAHRDLRDQAQSLADLADEMQNDNRVLADDAAKVMAVRFGALIADWNGQVDEAFEAKSRVLNRLCRSVVQLQRAMHRARRERFELARQEFQQEIAEEEDTKKIMSDPIWGLLEKPHLAEMFGGGATGDKIANYLLAVRSGDFNARLGLSPTNTSPRQEQAADAPKPRGKNAIRYVLSSWVTKTPKGMGYTLAMPWKETCVIDERMILISEHLTGDYTLRQLAQRRGVSRKTAYKWIGRYLQAGPEGLKDRSQAAHHHPNALDPQLERTILDWKERRPRWGAPKIHSKLWSLPDCPAESTVSNVLQRHGLTRARGRRRPRATPTPGPLRVAREPNEVWCADFKGWFALGNGQRCDPLTITDASSRFLLCCRALCGPPDGAVVRRWFEEVFGEYGLPQVIRTDNGPPFASVGLGGLSALSLWWLRLGIQVERIQPGHPEQNGTHERMHRTLEEALQPPGSNPRAQQKSFDTFRQDFNYDRPHEALGQQPPATVYRPSPRVYPRPLLEVDYPATWQRRQVRHNGQIRWQGGTVYIGETLVGQPIGLEPAGEGLWAVHFMTLPLGVLEEAENRVQRITLAHPLPRPPANGAPDATLRPRAEGAQPGRSGITPVGARPRQPDPQKSVTHALGRKCNLCA